MARHSADDFDPPPPSESSLPPVTNPLAIAAVERQLRERANRDGGPGTVDDEQERTARDLEAPPSRAAPSARRASEPAQDAGFAPRPARPAEGEPSPFEQSPVRPAPVEPDPVEPDPVEPSAVEHAPAEDPGRSGNDFSTMRGEEAHPRRGSWTAAVPGWSVQDDDLRIEPEQPHPPWEFSSEDSHASTPPPFTDDVDAAAEPVGFSVRVMLLCLGGGVLLAAVLSVLAVVPI